MAKDVILLGEVAQRTERIEIRCGRYDRVGRLRTAKLSAMHEPNAAMGDVMRAQVGDCPKQDARQIQGSVRSLLAGPRVLVPQA
jgi:hypothetical protein